jgi:hypothetical protein
VVYESGVFDEKPALIVGVTSANELAFLSKLPKKSLDSYIRDAAQRSLAEIAQSPFGNEILEKDPLEGFQDWMWVIGGILAAFGLGAVGMHKRRRSLAAILLAATMALTTSSRSNANTMPIPIAITHIASAVQDPQSPEKEATFALPNFSFLENLKGLVESARGIWRTKKAQNKLTDEILAEINLPDNGGLLRLLIHKGRFVYWLGSFHGHRSTLEVARFLAHEMEQYKDNAFAVVEEVTGESHDLDPAEMEDEWKIILMKTKSLKIPSFRSPNPMSAESIQKAIDEVQGEEKAEMIAAAFFVYFLNNYKNNSDPAFTPGGRVLASFRQCTRDLSELVGKSEKEVAVIALTAMKQWGLDTKESTKKISRLINIFLNSPNELVQTQLNQLMDQHPAKDTAFVVTGAMHSGASKRKIINEYSPEGINHVLDLIKSSNLRVENLKLLFAVKFPGIVRDPNEAPQKKSGKSLVSATETSWSFSWWWLTAPAVVFVGLAW